MSPGKATLHLIILHEPEVRKASLLLEQVVAAINATAEDAPLAPEVSRMLFDALDAANLALHGAHRAEAVLMLSAGQFKDVIERAKESL